MLSNLSNGVHVQDKITINLSAKNQYDKAYKSIVPVTGITCTPLLKLLSITLQN
jgi:hypothetical protein